MLVKLSISGFVFLVLVTMGVGCDTKKESTLCFLKTYTLTNPSGTISTTYDYQGTRLVSETTTGNGQSTVTTYIYDSLGNISVSSATTNGVALISSYLYDSINRLKRRVVDDAMPITTDYAYNEHSQLEKVTTTVGSADPPTLVVNYTYSDVVTRNPSMVTPVGGSSIRMTYDNKINPWRGFLSSIQPSNNVTQYISDLSVTITYQYNSAGYPVSAAWSNGSTGAWTYDCVEF